MSWFHDGSVPGPAKTGYGNNWVVAAVVVRPPASAGPWPSRCWPSWSSRTRDPPPGCGWPAAAYVDGKLKKLPPRVTWTTRLRKDAALYGLPPARTGKRGRPREKGDRLPSPAKLAATADFTQVTVTRHGKTAAIQAAALT